MWRNTQELRRQSYCTHSLTHPLTHSPTHPLTHSPTHPLTHSPTHPLTHSPTHPLTHSPTHPLTHSPTHPLTHSPTHPLTHSPSHKYRIVGVSWRWFPCPCRPKNRPSFLGNCAGLLLSARPSSTLSNSFFICSLEVGFLPFHGSSTLAMLPVFWGLLQML